MPDRNFVRFSIIDGLWGTWRDEVLLPLGQHVIGLQTRFEPPQRSGDDTGLNGIKMNAGQLFSPYPGTLPPVLPQTVTEGYWGVWGDFVNIPNGFRIIGMAVRNERSLGSGDDTALNGIELICANGPEIDRILVENGRWGDWQDDRIIPEGYYVAGMQARLEAPIGSGDDTALNGIRLLLRRLPPELT